jgi:phosphoribosylglycinamide formyltransferase 1
VTPVRTAILISGGGSNLQALLDDVRGDSHHPATIALVISNKADAYGVERAKAAGVPTMIISHKDYPTREAFDAALHNALIAADIDMVCLAGFMRLLTAEFTQQWARRMINIHPSLLPDYKGLHTHARVLADGVGMTGCTVHYVVPEMDAGEIITQETVPVMADDTVDILQQRVHAAEHIAYPRALRMAIAAYSIMFGVSIVG